MPTTRRAGTMPAGTMLVTVAGALALTLALTPAVDALRGTRPDEEAPVPGDVAAIEAGAGARGPEGQPTIALPADPPGSAGETLRLPAPTRARPLRLWIGTDLPAIPFGLALDRLARTTDLFTIQREARDAFDWPAHLAADVEADVLVVMFAGDDAPGPAGRDELRRRVAATMDATARPGRERLVLWVGLPAAGPAERQTAAVNAVYAAEAARRPWVRYVDALPFLADPFGRYAPALVNADGRTRVVRADDGVGLAPAGGARLARAVYARLATLVDLRAEPLAPDPAEEAPPSVSERDPAVVMAG